MGLLKYFSILAISVLTFFSMTLLLPYMEGTMFVFHIYFILFLLIIGAISLYLTGKNLRSGWTIFSLFYAAILIDTLIIYYLLRKGSIPVLSTVLLAILGIMTSFARKKVKKPIVEEYTIEPEKKASKKHKKSATRAG